MTVWLSHPRACGGYVTAGCKFLTGNGKLVTDRFGRTFLAHDVAPGQSVVAAMHIAVPSEIDPGRYNLQIDLVDELICWFSDTAPEPPTTYSIEVD